jgi:hypothetical protein
MSRGGFEPPTQGVGCEKKVFRVYLLHFFEMYNPSSLCFRDCVYARHVSFSPQTVPAAFTAYGFTLQKRSVSPKVRMDAKG